MLAIYDFEVFKHDWLVVLKNPYTKEYNIIHNSIDELKKVLKQYNFLVGFNNYNYDDLILFALLKYGYNNTDLYILSQSIVNGKEINFNRNFTSKLATFDCMQELKLGISLKVIECNLGLDIRESSVPFDISRPLTKAELDDVIKYCKHDVDTTEKVFNLRQDYFDAKVSIATEFKLDPFSVKKTRARIVGDVLKANKNNLPKYAIQNRLKIKYIDNIDWNNIPAKLKSFYDDIIERFKYGVSYDILEKESITIDVNGVEHTYGFGGVHGAKTSYKATDNILYFDVSSFYPSLMINYNFISRACSNTADYKNLYDTRFKLKAEKNKMEYIYKILLNASYGATKDKYNSMFDPLQANNICINGQLLLTDLIIRLSAYSELIQSNTDGIIIKYDPKDYDKIIDIKTQWENHYKLKLGQEILKAIYQRDVNNYLIVKTDGTVKGKGRMKNWNIEKVNFESYSLAIIDIALKRYYVDNISISDTINNLLENNKLLPFQLLVKNSSKYDGLVQYNRQLNKYIPLQKVNRVYATTIDTNGMIYKVKDNKYEKFTNTPLNTLVLNDEIEQANISNIIDRDWYINLCTNYLLENQTIKTKIKNEANQPLFFI